MNAPVQTVWLPIADAFGGHLALPPAGRGPGLLLWQEIFGVNEHIRAVAEQYALAGFVVLAPDAFWRTAPRVSLGYEAEDRQRGIALMGAMTPESTDADLRAALAALRAHPAVDGARIGAVGYCLGGRLAYLTAATGQTDAAVAYYGGGIQSMLDRAGGLRGGIQFHYAGQDDHIPPEAVERVRAAVSGKDAEVHVYPGSRHGFNCWARGTYHPGSAALALGRSLAFLAQRLF